MAWPSKAKKAREDDGNEEEPVIKLTMKAPNETKLTAYSMKSRRKQGDWLIGFRLEPEKNQVTKTQDWLRPQTLEKKTNLVKTSKCWFL